MVKIPPAVPEMWVQSLGWEDSLEKEKATHSSIYTSQGLKKSDTTEQLSLHRLQMPGFSALHYLPEFDQIHVQWVSDTI